MSIEEEVAKLAAGADNAVARSTLEQRVIDVETALRTALPHMTDAELLIAMADMMGRVIKRRGLEAAGAIQALSTVMALRTLQGPTDG